MGYWKSRRPVGEKFQLMLTETLAVAKYHFTVTVSNAICHQILKPLYKNKTYWEQIRSVKCILPGHS